MTNQAQSQAELANKEWLVNTPIDKFHKKFRFSGAHPRAQNEIDVITSMSRGIKDLGSCLEVLNAIGGIIQGTADKLGELALRRGRQVPDRAANSGSRGTRLQQ